jgi:hypothetical protein
MAASPVEKGWCEPILPPTSITSCPVDFAARTVVSRGRPSPPPLSNRTRAPRRDDGRMLPVAEKWRKPS